VGLAAIQIANLLGARPIALTRTSTKAQSLRTYGATAVVATDEQDVVAEIRRQTGGVGANLVFDPVGGPRFALLAKSAAAGGTLVMYGALDLRPTVVPPFDVFARDLTIRGVALPALARDDLKLAELKRFVSHGLALGALRPTIARTFEFDHIADAHRFIESGEQMGKIVATVWGSKTTPEQNKAVILEAFDTLFNKRDCGAAKRFWSERYIQHSAHIAPGREGMFNLIRSLPETLRYENLSFNTSPVSRQITIGSGERAALIARELAFAKAAGHGGPQWVVMRLWMAAATAAAEDQDSEHAMTRDVSLGTRCAQRPSLKRSHRPIGD
jgi:hypothetical protein